MRPRRRRRAFRPLVQLSFDLAVAPPPVVDVERITVGYFVGVLMSDGTWQLTVGPPIVTYYDSGKTPQQWWRERAADEYTLHQWSACKTRIVSERDDVESEPLPIDQRSVAVRWMRSFNEAFQTWRMSLAW